MKNLQKTCQTTHYQNSFQQNKEVEHWAVQRASLKVLNLSVNSFRIDLSTLKLDVFYIYYLSTPHRQPVLAFRKYCFVNNSPEIVIFFFAFCFRFGQKHNKSDTHKIELQNLHHQNENFDDIYRIKRPNVQCKSLIKLWTRRLGGACFAIIFRQILIRKGYLSMPKY